MVIGIVIYGLIYYFYIGKRAGKQYSQNQSTNIVSIQNNHLADPSGKTVYIFDKDTTGKSTCSGNCLKVWPPYLIPTTPPLSYPVNISVIFRDDGSLQYTWKGMPLYYYVKDTNPGDTKGDNVDGTWHLVRP